MLSAFLSIILFCLNDECDVVQFFIYFDISSRHFYNFQGKMYLDRYKADTRRIQQLRTDIKENTDKLVSLKNKKELMAKVIVENDVRKNERAQRMEAFRKHIDSLPQPGRNFCREPAVILRLIIFQHQCQ